MNLLVKSSQLFGKCLISSVAVPNGTFLLHLGRNYGKQFDRKEIEQFGKLNKPIKYRQPWK